MDLEAALAIARAAAGTSGPEIEGLSVEETDAVLDLTRAVAHAVERKAAPLAAYAIGRGLTDVNADDRLRILAETAARIDAAVVAEPEA